LAYRGGHVVTQPTSGERTAELARRLFREAQRGIGQPRLVVLTGLQTGARLEIPAPPSRLVIGRGSECQLTLDDAEVSAEHAELVRDLDGVLVRNLASTNGIEVGGSRVDERRLKDGDELTVGKTQILFEEPADEPMRAVLAQEDQVMTRATPTPAAPEPTPEPEPEAPAPQAVEAAKPKAPSRSGNDADLVIYTLALIVIAVSLAGLFVLLSAD
jgi:pSer/pThr/pTyr-binding forkhead associated (FHA) protein